jgi:Nucleoside transporter
VFPGEITSVNYHGTIHGMSFLVRALSAPLCHNSDALSMVQGTKDWWSVILFFIFNIFDTVGRYSPGLCKLFSERFLVVRTPVYLCVMKGLIMPVVVRPQIPSLGRLVFVPLFIGAVYWHGGFQNDVYVALVMVVFSLSNGYIASLSMMYGPAKVRGFPALREILPEIPTLLFLRWNHMSVRLLAW